MNQFEESIRPTLLFYRQKNIAFIDYLPIPTKQIGVRGGMPVFVRVKISPFDLYGFSAHGTFIGAELKSSKRKARLPIIAPDSKGDGLQFHQLDSLALVEQSQGIGILVWNNGGEVGTIRGPEILNTLDTYVHAMKAEAHGRSARGSKSIEWERFSPCPELPGGAGPDWLSDPT